MIKNYLPTAFYFIILFMGSSIRITSSSISLERKTINILKSLPVDEKMVLKSKILACYIITLPILIILSILFIIRFKVSILYSGLILILNIVIIRLMSCIGLIVNLKYPNMNASNDTEAMKQNIGSLIYAFIGILIFAGSMIAVYILSNHIQRIIVLILHLMLLSAASEKLYTYLMEKGVEEYKEINV